MNLRESATPHASAEVIQDGWRLEIPRGDAQRYRLAQLDDYFRLPRRKYPHESLTIDLRARVSSRSIPGTWGFGLWNDPQAVSVGIGGAPFLLPALPNAAWFFNASEENYLSFTDDRPGSGFLAQAFRAPGFHPLLVPAGLALPFSRRATRKMLGKIIDEDAAALSVDSTAWHRYKLEWSPVRSVFWVDGALVLESGVSPRSPLGLVIWIDNQYAAFTPSGKIRFGVLENPEPAWLEIKDLQLS